MPKRTSKLGEIGERIAMEESLPKHGFRDILSLNSYINNFPFADIFAKKESQIYLISVKTRNKYERNSKNINKYYKLDGVDKAYKIVNFFKDVMKCSHVKVAWLTIQIAEKVYCAYFGTFFLKEPPKTIYMDEDSVKTYECFALNVPLPKYVDYDEIKNIQD